MRKQNVKGQSERGIPSPSVLGGSTYRVEDSLVVPVDHLCVRADFPDLNTGLGLEGRRRGLDESNEQDCSNPR